MEFFGEILPVLIFILIPVLRGLNRSKKQKQEYESKRSGTKYAPPTKRTQTTSTTPWKGIVGEVGKELRGLLEESKEKPIAQKKQEKEYSAPQQSNKSQENTVPTSTSHVNKHGHYEGMTIENIKKDEISLNEDYVYENTSNVPIKNLKDLEFSPNPLVQGLIFSEILGPPKSKKR